jgi:hypothetical protein
MRREEGVMRQTKVFGLKWDEGTYTWRKLHKLCSSHNIRMVMMSRKVTWTGFIAHEEK